jgi:hypothetical protein
MRQHTLLNAMKGVKLQIKGNIAGKKRPDLRQAFFVID